VREGSSRWRADSGQYVLDFEGDPAAGSLSIIEHPPAAPTLSGAHEWFDRGIRLERNDIDGAIDAYERAVVAEPTFLDAHINLGRLLHESRRYASAERAYREAIRTCGRDAVLLYNLAVLLDDQKRTVEAVVAYEQALAIDPGFADCHYNLALAYERLRRPKEATAPHGALPRAGRRAIEMSARVVRSPTDRSTRTRLYEESGRLR
jgi:tetratricopeptide (TPR) repeat protein